MLSDVVAAYLSFGSLANILPISDKEHIFTDLFTCRF